MSSRTNVPGPQVGQNRGEERGKQVYTTQVHNLDTKLPCPGYEIKHGTEHWIVRICMHINAVANSVMLQLHLWHYCRHNIISEIKGKYYNPQGQPPHPMKTSWRAPMNCLHVLCNSRSKQRLCPWTTLSSWFLVWRSLVFAVRYELCFLYSVVTELMLRDMRRSMWQWWSAVRCWLFDGHCCQFGGGTK